jgi:hypothetical protein
VTKLTKHDVENLLEGYDHDPVGALTVALQKVLDLPDGSWSELVAAAPVDDHRRHPLLAQHLDSLDDLARELNECRGFQRPT